MNYLLQIYMPTDPSAWERLSEQRAERHQRASTSRSEKCPG